MAIFDGRYQWDGIKRGNDEPITWSPGAYNIKIFSCVLDSKKVQNIKEYVCIYAATGDGQSISANPEKFAKQICNDFSLDIERVLWVEDLLTDKDRYQVVMFTPSFKMADNVFYRTHKRLAREPEILMIQHELSRRPMHIA